MNEEKVRQPDFLQKGLMQYAFFIFAVLVWIVIILCLANYFYILESPQGEMAQIVGIAEGIFAGLIILYFILPWITWTMFTKTQKLEKAIEADQFFQLVNKTTKDRLHYIKQNKLRVFIAEKPLNNHVQNDIKAAYYYFLTRFLPIKTNWYIALGQKRVCFDLEQVDTLIDSAELENELVKNINLQMQDQYKELQKTLNRTKGNLSRDTKYAVQDMLFWDIGKPMLTEMIAEDKDAEDEDTKNIFIKEEISVRFRKHAKNNPEAAERLKSLLKVANIDSIKLPGHILDVMVNELKNAGLKNGRGQRNRKK